MAREQVLAESTHDIHIDVSKIPKHTQNYLASATIDLIRGILAQPEGREALDNKIAELGI